MEEIHPVYNIGDMLLNRDTKQVYYLISKENQENFICSYVCKELNGNDVIILRGRSRMNRRFAKIEKETDIISRYN